MAGSPCTIQRWANCRYQCCSLPMAIMIRAGSLAVDNDDYLIGDWPSKKAIRKSSRLRSGPPGG
jgi:hypothetical protein